MTEETKNTKQEEKKPIRITEEARAIAKSFGDALSESLKNTFKDEQYYFF